MRNPTIEELLEIYLRDSWYNAYSWEEFQTFIDKPRFQIKEEKVRDDDYE